MIGEIGNFKYTKNEKNNTNTNLLAYDRMGTRLKRKR